MPPSTSEIKQLVVLSGKGGTGKSSLVAAFAHLSSLDSLDPHTIIVDADVDAANLRLVIQPQESSPAEFWGGSLADIDPELCLGCGDCASVCRYDAVIQQADRKIFQIDPMACDGCAACVYACPQKAISMIQQQEGLWFYSKTPYGDLYDAELFPGKENSGKLVTTIKQRARLCAEENHASLIVVDGPPGIGCPVISACAGANLGLIVTEPSVMGLHDLKRILGVLQHFKIPTVICINKSDLYPEGTRHIEEFASLEGIQILESIPFDEHIPQAMLKGMPITAAFPNSESAKSIRHLWDSVLGLLNREAKKE